MKLYSVVIEIEIPVAVQAEDEDHAWELAREDIGEILRDTDIRGIMQAHIKKQVRTVKDLPEGWDERCIPYGGDGNTRIAEILAPQEAEG